ncbi:unnamed protein product [Urochloa humidicola]
MASSASTSSGDGERPSAGAGAPRDTAAGAGAAPPQQGHAAEWAAAASMQAYYASGGQPYAWHAAQQHMMVAAAGAPYGAPVPFPVSFHPALLQNATFARHISLGGVKIRC